MATETIMALAVALGLDSSQLEAGLKKSETNVVSSTNKMGASNDQLAKSLLGPIAGYMTLAGAIAGAIAFERAAILEAADEEAGLASLNATIQSMNLSTVTSAENIRAMGEAMQAANGIFSHDDLEKAAQSLLRIEGFDVSKLESSLKTIRDYAAGAPGGMISAAQAGQQIAQALETGMVRSLGFSMALRTQVQDMIKAGDRGGALALIMDTLNSKYGGQAAAQLDTYNGKVKVLTNSWAELLATAGGSGLGAGKSVVDYATKTVNTTTQLMTIQQKITAESFKTLTVWEKLAVWTLGGPINDFKIVVGLLTTNLPHAAAEAQRALYEMAGGYKLPETQADTTALDIYWGRVTAAAYDGTLAAARAADEAVIKAAEELNQAIISRSNWEVMYSGAKSAADQSAMTFDYIGQQIQGISDKGGLIWESYLAATGQISPAALEQFVKMEVMIQRVKDMAAAGISVSVIVDTMMGEMAGLGAGGTTGGPESGWAFIGKDLEGFFPGSDVYWNAATGAYSATIPLTVNPLITTTTPIEGPAEAANTSLAGLQESYNSTVAAITANPLKFGADGTLALSELDKIQAARDALTDKTIIITVKYVVEGGPGYASGADFTVPAGFPNDSFPFRAQSGEHITVTPSGRVASPGGGSNYSSNGIDLGPLLDALQALPRTIRDEVQKIIA